MPVSSLSSRWVICCACLQPGACSLSLALTSPKASAVLLWSYREVGCSLPGFWGLDFALGKVALRWFLARYIVHFSQRCKPLHWPTLLCSNPVGMGFTQQNLLSDRSAGWKSRGRPSDLYLPSPLSVVCRYLLLYVHWPCRCVLICLSSGRTPIMSGHCPTLVALFNLNSSLEACLYTWSPGTWGFNICTSLTAMMSFLLVYLWGGLGRAFCHH